MYNMSKLKPKDQVFLGTLAGCSRSKEVSIAIAKLISNIIPSTSSEVKSAAAHYRLHHQSSVNSLI